MMEAAPVSRLSTLTLGLVGFGNIARHVASRTAAFGVTILWYDPSLRAEEARCREEGRTGRKLLAEADLISIHTPLTTETKGLFSDNLFSRNAAARISGQLLSRGRD